MTKPTLTVQQLSEHVAQLIVTNPAPGVVFTSSKDYRTHAFGLNGRPRFRMERPYSPDDAWLLEVDRTGGLASDLPSAVGSFEKELDAFFERRIDEPSFRLLAALPTGRYLLVRSPRRPEPTKEVLLGNELVPAPPNMRVLYYKRPFYAAVFGAHDEIAPSLSGLLVAVAVLSYNGDNTLDGIWTFDLHGAVPASVSSGELSVVLPLESSLIVDAMATFRTARPEEAHEIRECWANKRGPAFARWLSGESEAT